MFFFVFSFLNLLLLFGAFLRFSKMTTKQMRKKKKEKEETRSCKVSLKNWKSEKWKVKKKERELEFLFLLHELLDQSLQSSSEEFRSLTLWSNQLRPTTKKRKRNVDIFVFPKKKKKEKKEKKRKEKKRKQTNFFLNISQMSSLFHQPFMFSRISVPQHLDSLCIVLLVFCRSFWSGSRANRTRPAPFHLCESLFNGSSWNSCHLFFCLLLERNERKSCCFFFSPLDKQNNNLICFWREKGEKKKRQKRKRKKRKKKKKKSDLCGLNHLKF